MFVPPLKLSFNPHYTLYNYRVCKAKFPKVDDKNRIIKLPENRSSLTRSGYSNYILAGDMQWSFRIPTTCCCHQSQYEPFELAPSRYRDQTLSQTKASINI